MKHLLLAVFCLALFAGCKKKADQSVAISITGKWTLKKLSGKSYTNNKLVSDTTFNVTDTSRHVQFNSDGTGSTTVGIGGVDKVVTVVNVGGNFTYKLSGANLKFSFPGDVTADQTVSRQDKTLIIHYELTFDPSGKYNANGTSKISGDQYYEQ